MAFFQSRSTSPKSSSTSSQSHATSSQGNLESDIQRIGGKLLQAARGHEAGLLSRKFWSDSIMQMAMKDPAFKVQLFRFIDAYPTLTTPQQVHEVLVDYLSQPGVTPPAALGMGIKAGGFLKGTLAKTIASQVNGMAGKFIGAADVAAAPAALRKLWDRGLAFSVDLLGEACVSDAEADAYQSRYRDLIQTLPDAVANWPGNPICDTDHLGPIPRANVSVKITSLYSRVSVVDFEGSLRGLTDALLPLLRLAKEKNVLINFDMEQYALKDLTIALFQRCCETLDFPAGLAMQAYLRSGPDDAANLIRWATKTGRQVTVRLIKGAYWDYETIHARQMNWPSPVWAHKTETDATFERMAGQFIDAIPRTTRAGGVTLAIGSHNARSIAAALAMLDRAGLPRNAIELQMLHGMADELKTAAIEAKLRVREYVPVGEMVPGMAYLVRRLLENTSNESWLRAGFVEAQSVQTLLAPPTPPKSAPAPEKPGTLDEPFVNEPLRDFSIATVRKSFDDAVRGAVVPISNDATETDAKQAVAKAQSAFAAWRDVPWQERAQILWKAADAMHRQRDELSAVVARESGKVLVESDADVCEAIDFCRYYAHHARDIFEPKSLGNITGEANLLWHEPRGVAVIISPWNFPSSICCGMTVAALVCGNPTIVKPAEQTPGIAKLVCEILWTAGAPADALQLLCGAGEVVGAALVRDPRVALIAFTGSKAVGLDIWQAAASPEPAHPFMKRVICEMGGKNAIIVDATADLDEAVLGVRQSAFGYCGQKCSAASRVIVVGEVYDAFLRRLVEATKALRIGDPLNPATDLGPVIDADAAAKIQQYIGIGKSEAKLELAIRPPADVDATTGKPFVGPHIFSNVRPTDRIAQEEIFGPVLSVMRAETFDEALAIANGTAYKLTGGVFSRTPSNLEKARKEFRVGNLYFNRGITGALVGRQPFGGFGLSGAGTKAGGAEYLLQFVDPRVCTENTMRRGFSPDS
jgi:RHH-type transcriptional regulator, proline utilization regulon repressor / proline dehydrogenase / delta 1-pyrroline-5-carboxylate dehydrogenase